MEDIIMRTNAVATWDSIGTSIVGMGKQTHLAEALDKANLNYYVGKENITTASGLIIPGKQATVKHYADGSTAVAGVVSPSYEIMQNIDAFNFVDDLVDEGVEIIKAGETYTGMIYLIGKMPEVTVLGDTFQPNIIFQNSHNGTKTLAATICLLRIACQNQFASTFKNADNAIKLRHTRTLEQRLALSQNILREAYTYAETFGDDAEELAKMGFEIDRKAIVIKDAIKEVGDYTAAVKLHKEVSASINLHVVSENETPAEA